MVCMALKELKFTFDVESAPLPPSIDAWISLARREIELFWDQSSKTKKKEYVECDFRFVAGLLSLCQQTGLFPRHKLLEWGCGFGVVTGIAELLGLSAVGIEAERFLVKAALRLQRQGGLKGEIWHANFLPVGASELAESGDPRISLQFSSLPSAYELHDSHLHDFGCIFCYAWPGEEHFLKQVFDRFAAPSTALILFRGPFHAEVYRKL